MTTKYIAYPWPEYQEYMGEEWFREECYYCADKDVYFIPINRVNESENKEIKKDIIRNLKRYVNCIKDGYDASSAKDFVVKEIEKQIAWLEKQGENNKSLYIRFGDIPKNEKSKVYNGEIEIGTEKGVSVYPAFEDSEGNIVLGLSLPITKTSLYTQQHLLEYDNRACYLVSGDYVGKGTDGEPLLRNIKIIREIKDFRVKQGEQETLCDKCRKEHPSHSCQDITELGRCSVEHEQKSDNSYCQENCKGFQETGKCFADGDCKAKREAKSNDKVEQSSINEIEIPFGAKDSELQEAIYHIPKGFYAEIDNDKVVIKKGEKPTAWSEDDERIKKRLINLVNEVYDNTNYITFLEHKELLAWLEKQGEQNPTDRVEPKFHEGDWIVSPDNLVCKITHANSHSYTLHLYNNDYRIFETESWYIDKKYHLWTIADARDGDVLFHSDSAFNGIFIFKEIIDKGFAKEVICYCDYDSEDNFCLGEHHTCCWSDAKILYPATKEQRDTLFAKMKEAGYTFDFEKKELKKIEQEQDSINPSEYINDIGGNGCYLKNTAQVSSWSKKDEKMFEYALNMIEWYSGKNEDKSRFVSDWLKSIKQRIGG